MSVCVALSIITGVGLAQAAAQELIAVGDGELLVARPGTLTNLASVPVDGSQIGQVCRLSVVSQNQASIHNGNNLVVTTGDVATVIEDVEAEANAAIDLSIDITLGETILIDLEMGPDWVSSLGFELWLDCGAAGPALQGNTQNCTTPDTTVSNGDSDTPVSNGDSDTPAGTVDEAQSDSCSNTNAVTEPEPILVEVPGLPPITDPVPCPDPALDIGSLTVVDPNCPTSEPSEPVAEPSVEPTTAEPAASPATPDETVTVTPPATPTTTDDPDPEVLGVQIQRLPATPAATAIPASPTYNG